MLRALKPSLITDQEEEKHNQTTQHTREAHTQWFKDYAALISKTIDEHNAQSSVTEHIKNKEQKKELWQVILVYVI